MPGTRKRRPRKGIVLVDGAGGFLGSHVVERLCHEGWEVRATDLPSADLSCARAAGAEVVRADLLDTDAAKDLVRGVRSVVHIAGLFKYSLPLETLRRANVEATRRLCEASADAGIERFVHISSNTVYGSPVRTPIKEDHPRLPDNAYGLSKKEGEDVALSFCRDRGLPVVSLRPAGIYGPRSRYGLADFFACTALLRAKGMRRAPLVEGGPVMHHVHVGDVARAILVLLEAPVEWGEAYNVGDETPLALGDLFACVYEQIGIERSFSIPYAARAARLISRLAKVVPAAFFDRMNASLARAWQEVVQREGLEPALTPRIDRDYLGYFVGDFSLATSKIKALGFEPQHPSTVQGIADTIQWYRAQHWLPPRHF
jgi:nucleoside-diphosphate-sugar epimerase